MASTISLLQDEILIDGVSTKSVTQALTASGLQSGKVAEIVGFWYLGALGVTRPAPFDFATDVQATDPNCVVAYARQFEHVDWQDGESRVQAGTTAEELGFNARFHAIENELDAISDQFGSLGACVAEIRADLVGVVRELESKITALQNSIHDLTPPRPGPIGPIGPITTGGLGIVGSAVVDNKDVFITQVGNEFRLIEFAGATVGRPTTGGPVLPTPGVFDPGKVTPDDFPVLVAQVEDLFAHPAIKELVDRPGGATVAEIRAVTGAVVLPSGIGFASVIAAMPADARFTDAAGALAGVTSHLVGILPAPVVSGLKDAVLVDPAARDRTGSALLNTGINALSIDPAVEGALRGAGVTTIGGLSRVTVTDLQGMLGAAGTEVSTEKLRAVVARAQVARALRGAAP
jgi:hypothetical protein